MKKAKTIDEVCGKPAGSFEKFCKENPNPDKTVSQNLLYNQYPRIKQLGLTIVTDCDKSIPGIKGEDLKNKLTKKQLELFNKYFGVQTVGMNGIYVYDCEAVLERIFSGKLQGTQKNWD